jgi:Ca2+-binding EF-hand superfamily protein
MIREKKRNVKVVNRKKSYKQNKRKRTNRERSYKQRTNRKRMNRKRTNRKRMNRKRSKSKIGGGALDESFNKLFELRRSEQQLRRIKEEFSDNDKKLGVEIYEGVSLYGLQYCLKEKYRLDGKIDKKLLEIDKVEDKYKFLLKAFAQDPVKDVLRFTIIFNGKEGYLAKLQHINNQLKNGGLHLHPQHYLQEIRIDSLEYYVPEGMKPSDEDKIQKAFQILDKAGDGKISHGELKNFLSNNGILVHDMPALFDRLDRDHDGNISVEDFHDFFPEQGQEQEQGQREIKQVVQHMTTKLKRSVSHDTAFTPPESPVAIQDTVQDETPLGDEEYVTQLTGVQSKLLLHGEVECLKEKYVNDLFQRANQGLDKMKELFSGLTLTGRGGGGIKGVDRWHTDEAYKGLNAVYLLELEDRHVPVEIQYHTSESIEMKQQIHDKYEEMQNLDHQITEIKKEMLSSFRTLEAPFEKQDGDDGDVNLRILYDAPSLKSFMSSGAPSEQMLVGFIKPHE